MQLRFLVLCFILAELSNGHKLAVYWGQDSAGGLKYTLEKEIDYYCKNLKYDIIPIAFLDMFFDSLNKDSYPSINLANHCNKTFKGYPGLLNCPKVAEKLEYCQTNGRKILISLGGAAGIYYFSSSTQAVTFANTVWNLFLGGRSSVRPFGSVILDGIDLDIEAGSTAYYADFVRAIRSLMNADNSKQYLITGAPQCPYPDVIMGPGSKGSVLHDVPQEFDYLFVQFYNNYCYLGALAQFNSSYSQWSSFAAATKKAKGKGPLIMVGLPAHPRASSGSRYYRTPAQVEAVYGQIRNDKNFGGFMLWDASFDSVNVIDGRAYSQHINDFLHKEPEIAICYGPRGYFSGSLMKPWILITLGIFLIICAGLILVLVTFRRRKVNLKKADINSMAQVNGRKQSPKGRSESMEFFITE